MKKYIRNLVILLIISGICFIYAHINKMHAIFNVKVDPNDYISTAVEETGQFEQRFTVKEKSLDGIALKFAKTGENIEKVKLIYSLEDEKGNVVGSGILKGKDFKNQKYNKLNFEHITDTFNKEFVFKCHAENNDETNGISLYFEGKTLVLKYYVFRFDLETFIVAFGLCFYVVVFMKILFKMFKE